MEKPITLRLLSVFEEVNIIPGTDNQTRVVFQQPVLTFFVPFIPTQLSFNIAVIVSHFSVTEQYNLDLVVIRESEEIQRMPWIIQQFDQLQQDQVPQSAFFISNVKNLIISSEGMYKIVLQLDGKNIGECFFDVMLQERVNNND